jgi:hypothetical protein
MFIFNCCKLDCIVASQYSVAWAYL